jgi:hypothetical protein
MPSSTAPVGPLSDTWPSSGHDESVASEPLPAFTRQRIAGLAETAMQQAGVIGVFPTPMDGVREAVGVTQVIDVSELPPDLAAKKPPAWRRILGAMWFDERIVFIDRSEPGARVHWTDAHEATHAMCAWHEQSLLLDSDETLFEGAP